MIYVCQLNVYNDICINFKIFGSSVVVSCKIFGYPGQNRYPNRKIIGSSVRSRTDNNPIWEQWEKCNKIIGNNRTCIHLVKGVGRWKQNPLGIFMLDHISDMTYHLGRLTRLGQP